MVVYRKTIYSFAERYRLPTIYPYRVFAAEGGLMSYGVDVADLLRGAASYIDRIPSRRKAERTCSPAANQI